MCVPYGAVSDGWYVTGQLRALAPNPQFNGSDSNLQVDQFTVAAVSTLFFRVA